MSAKFVRARRAVWTVAIHTEDEGVYRKLKMKVSRAYRTNAFGLSEQATELGDHEMAAYMKAKGLKINSGSEEGEAIFYDRGVSRSGFTIEFQASLTGMNSMRDHCRASEWYGMRITDMKIDKSNLRGALKLADLPWDASPEDVMEKLSARIVEYNSEVSEYLYDESIELPASPRDIEAAERIAS